MTFADQLLQPQCTALYSGSRKFEKYLLLAKERVILPPLLGEGEGAIDSTAAASQRRLLKLIEAQYRER